MSPRLLIPLLALLVALALPAASGAAVVNIDTAPKHDDGAISGKRALHKAEALLDGRGVERGFELTPLLKRVAVALPNMSHEDQVRARKLLARPTDPGGSPDEPSYSVPEQTPYCTAHFCIHWVATTSDAPPLGPGPVPAYVEETAATFDHVYQRENVELGWRAPKSDGTRGCGVGQPTAVCANKTDVYIKQIGDDGLYGFASTDPGQSGRKRAAYLVVDDDYAEDIFSDYSDPYDPLHVTAAHEYNHVLQYAYDVFVGTWFFESTATWMEDVVYPAVNDYLQYLPDWAALTLLPLTNELGSTDEFIGKTYGNAVWNIFLASRFGPDVNRNAWGHIDEADPANYAPDAYDRALKEKGSSFYKAFTSFAADSAEWRAANSPFPEGAAYPNVARVIDDTNGLLTIGVDGSTVQAEKLPHVSYALVNVKPTTKPKIKLITNGAPGARMAAALVGRTGGQTSGQMKVVLKRLPHGGGGIAVMDNPGQYKRLTIALINGDARTTGRRFSSGEWQYRPATYLDARVSSDFTPPRITHRSPGAGKHGVSRRTSVKVRFSERMRNVSSKTALIRDRSGKRVKAKVKLTGKGRKLRITPRSRLRAHKRYTVRLKSIIRDRGANPLARASRTWTFTTRR